MFCVLCLFIASLSKAANRRAIKMAPSRERALKRATKLTMVTVTASMIINPITFQNNKPFSSISSPSAGSFLFACRTRGRVTGRGRGNDSGKRGIGGRGRYGDRSENKDTDRCTAGTKLLRQCEMRMGIGDIER